MLRKTRKPAVSGMFYPANKNKLIKLIEDIDSKETANFDKLYSEKKIIGGVVPHAGYMYSGYQAVHFFKTLKLSKQPIDTIIILNPNHRGINSDVALDDSLYWETPLGKTEVDIEFSKALDLPFSSTPHLEEHSAEVMLPFIQYYLKEDIKIVPVSILDQSYEMASKLANKIKQAVSKTGKNIIIIASNDFSHYVNPEIGHKQDNFVCEKIKNFDAKGVYEVVISNNISLCGYGPIMSLIEYSKFITPECKSKILRRGNSGDVTPSDKVVNYICILFFE